MSNDGIEKLAEAMGAAHRILFFTGAGISTNSGIPDYRGPQGVWKTRQPVYYQDFMSSEEARVEYWNQKSMDWERFRDAEPNAIHRAIAELEEAGRVLQVVTQNIDGLHAKAGTSREKLIEIHGTNAEIECQSCHERSEPGPHFKTFVETRKAPRCSCGGLLKPATISFGQSLRSGDIECATTAAAHSDLLIALGSTLSVYPAAAVPLAAVEAGVPYVIINRGATDHDGQPGVTLRLEGDVADFLPAAVAKVLKG